MNNRIIIGVSAGMLFMLATFSCSVKDNIAASPSADIISDDNTSGAAPGVMFVKFKSEPDENALTEFSASGVYELSRLYPPAGRFEKRHREAGLHLWYVVNFNKQRPLTKASGDFSENPMVEYVEFVHPIKTNSVSFNDPRLPSQWHYYNNGSLTGSVAGCDINLLPAWEIETGSPDVIVAVSDGGVDFTHEDLSRNMWVNSAEYGGTAGVDDDGNGYVDDVYGYSFLVTQPATDNPGHIVFDNHGTHVAGTIAAVNNNGLGVCGIAGGDGSATSGVRIMTLQTSSDSTSSYIRPPFVYAADNGAVLMNCSWGYEEAPDISSLNVFREAVGYFNKYAGFDEHGNQTGPMAGGLAIFAAGNESTDVAYPMMEDCVFTVASIGPDYHIAYYSNYGDWVDISAPGGDSRKSANVVSTVPGGYGSMQGTSMACPHVTGVAALVVSQFKGPGFTRQNLIDILTNSARNIDSYNNSYVGKLGAGLLDAGTALRASKEVPDAPGTISSSCVANFITLGWPHAASTDSKLPFSYEIYCSKASLAGLDPDNPGKDVRVVTVPARYIQSGETAGYRFSGLEFETDYHFRVRSVSILDKYSDLTSDLTVHTGVNRAPVVSPLEGTNLNLKSFETGTLTFNVEDPDGHDLSCSLEGLGAAKAELSDGKITLTVNALDYDDNSTISGKLIVTDSYDPTPTEITCSIAANTVPVVTSAAGDIVINSIGESVSVDMSKLFSDADGEKLNYSVRSVGTGTIANSSVSGSGLTLKSVAYGLTTIRVTASDARKTSVSQDFKLLVRDGSREVELYPVPVQKELNVRTGVSDVASIRITNKAGITVYEGSDLAVDPFAPLSIDLGDLKTGVYYLHYTGSVIDRKYTISKK